MNAARAKRRLLKWHRYLRATHSVPAHRLLNRTHRGHIKAWSDVMYAQRYAPIGAREPWRYLAVRGDDFA